MSGFQDMVKTIYVMCILASYSKTEPSYSILGEHGNQWERIGNYVWMLEMDEGDVLTWPWSY